MLDLLITKSTLKLRITLPVNARLIRAILKFICVILLLRK